MYYADPYQQDGNQGAYRRSVIKIMVLEGCRGQVELVSVLCHMFSDLWRHRGRYNKNISKRLAQQSQIAR